MLVPAPLPQLTWLSSCCFMPELAASSVCSFCSSSFTSASSLLAAATAASSSAWRFSVSAGN